MNNIQNSNFIILKNILITVIIIFSSRCSGQYDTPEKINNLIAFSKLYGYIQFFHPSDEASEIDWDKFLIYGINRIEQIKQHDSLKYILEDLFLPIAPTLQIIISNNIDTLQIISCENQIKKYSKHNLISWEHIGYGGNNNVPFKSERNNKYSKFEIKKKQLNKDLCCIFPNGLYRNKKKTFPQSERKKNKILKNELKKVAFLENDNHSVLIANVIKTWNVLQHFFPYFENLKLDWDAQQVDAFKRIHSKNYNQQEILNYLTEPLKDSHIRIYDKKTSEIYFPPIVWRVVENKVVVTKVLDDSLDIKIGDIILEIKVKF
jgi:hypothetical protein